MFAPSAPPLALPPQSEHRGRTQTANKTGIRRVSTHSRLQQKKFPDTPRPPTLFSFFTNFFHCSFFSVAHSSLTSTLFYSAPMFVSSLGPHIGVETFSHGGRPFKKK